MHKIETSPLEELCDYEGVTECQVAFDECRAGSNIHCLILVGSCSISELQIGSDSLEELLNSSVKCLQLYDAT